LKSNNLYLGDCLDLLAKIEDQTIDLVFLDPPYNLQLNKVLTRPNHSIVNGVNQDWDKFDSYSSYDDFTFSYLTECKRVLKPDGGLWVIGSYHNIFRIGKILQDLNFWILNDVIWAKSNPYQILGQLDLLMRMKLLFGVQKNLNLSINLIIIL